MTLQALLARLHLADHLSEIVALTTLAIALFALIGWWREAGRIRRRNRARQRAASVAEIEAERLLARYGFVVIDRQVTAWWSMWVDGKERKVSCRIDLLVHPRDDPNSRLVAEVKTGDRATDPTFPSTRRQLLEYARVFDADGVLLLDMERRRLHRIEF